MLIIKENIVRNAEGKALEKYKKMGYVEFKPYKFKEKKVSEMNKSELMAKITELNIQLEENKEYTNAELKDLIIGQESAK